MLVLFEKLHTVTNDRSWISAGPIYILIMIYIFCCRSWVWWDHVAWPLCIAGPLWRVQETNWLMKMTGHTQMFHSLFYMWHAYKKNQEVRKQLSQSVTQSASQPVSVQWSVLQLSQEKSAVSQQWHCCEASSKYRTDLRGWGGKCSKYW
jgi:hypothetical protein